MPRAVIAIPEEDPLPVPEWLSVAINRGIAQAGWTHEMYVGIPPDAVIAIERAGLVYSVGDIPTLVIVDRETRAHETASVLMLGKGFDLARDPGTRQLVDIVDDEVRDFLNSLDRRHDALRRRVEELATLVNHLVQENGSLSVWLDEALEHAADLGSENEDLRAKLVDLAAERDMLRGEVAVLEAMGRKTEELRPAVVQKHTWIVQQGVGALMAGLVAFSVGEVQAARHPVPDPPPAINITQNFGTPPADTVTEFGKILDKCNEIEGIEGRVHDSKADD